MWTVDAVCGPWDRSVWVVGRSMWTVDAVCGPWDRSVWVARGRPGNPSRPGLPAAVAESVDCGFRSATCVNTFGDHGAEPPPVSPSVSLSVSGVLRLVTNRGGLAGWGGGRRGASPTSHGHRNCRLAQHGLVMINILGRGLVPPWPSCHGFPLAWHPSWPDTLTPAPEQAKRN
jgi:hypothetical protein